jgi:hypothetical protein
VHPEQRVGAADRPVAAAREVRAGFRQRRERVLPGGPGLAQERDRQLGHLRLVGGPQRLDVGGRPERGEPRDVVGVDDLQVRQMVADGRIRVGPPRRFDRVERVAHRAVAERVEVHLEAVGVELGDEPGEFVGVDEVEAGVVGRAAMRVEVRVEQRGGVVLGHPVQHHLHAGGPEPADGVAVAPVQQLGQLLESLVPLPPQRPDDVHPQRARAGGPIVGIGRVVLAEAAADDRVLPAGDAE